MVSQEICDHHQELFDKFADNLRQLAMREIAEGHDLDEFVLLLFDMADPTTDRIVREFIPDLAAEDIKAPPGHSAVICATTSAGDGRKLAASAPGVEKSLDRPLATGEIKVLTLSDGCIFHFRLVLIPAADPSDFC